MARKKTETEETPAVESTTEENKTRKTRVSSADAVFLEDGFGVERPPAGLRDYELTAYDDALDTMWDRYQEAGSPAWSRAVSPDHKPEGGYWSERDDIYYTALVPDAENARALIARAARRIGCSFRFRTRDESTADTSAHRIWFTVAPLLPRGATTNEDGKPEDQDD